MGIREASNLQEKKRRVRFFLQDLTLHKWTPPGCAPFFSGFTNSRDFAGGKCLYRPKRKVFFGRVNCQAFKCSSMARDRPSVYLLAVACQLVALQVFILIPRAD
jgi:hypothetical protein